MKNIIPVEIKGLQGQYYKGYITGVPNSPSDTNNSHANESGSINGTSSDVNKVTVEYESCNFQCTMPLSTLSYPIHSQSDSNSAVFNFGDKVEVWWMPEDQPTSNQNEPSDPRTHAWWPGRVRKIRDQLVGVEISYQKGDELTPHQDIVEKSQLRKCDNVHRQEISSLEHIAIEVPNLVDDESTRNEIDNLLVRIKGEVLLSMDIKNQRIHIYSLDPKVIHRVALLRDMFLRLHEKKTQLLNHGRRIMPGNSNGSIQSSNEFNEVIDVDPSLVGLAIGYQGANMAAARSIEGVTQVTFSDETKQFSVRGKTREAVKKARDLLEFVIVDMRVPQSLVPRVIGRQGQMIHEIIEKAVINKINVEDPVEENDSNESISDEPNCVFSFTGLKQNVEDAMLMMEFNIEQLKTIDELQAKVGVKLNVDGNQRGVRYGGPRNSNYNGNTDSTGASSTHSQESDSQYSQTNSRKSMGGGGPQYNRGAPQRQNSNAMRGSRGNMRGNRGGMGRGAGNNYRGNNRFNNDNNRFYNSNGTSAKSREERN